MELLGNKVWSAGGRDGGPSLGLFGGFEQRGGFSDGGLWVVERDYGGSCERKVGFSFFFLVNLIFLF